jgi:putative tryptophan/tyrosine transport system substrate-binding protein
MLFALCFPTQAQQPAKVPRIGYLSNREKPNANSPRSVTDVFRQGMRELGYLEGKNILIEYRYAAGAEDRFPGFVAELVELKVDLIVSPSWSWNTGGEAGE